MSLMASRASSIDRVLGDRVGAAHLAGDDDAVGGGEGLAGDADASGRPVGLEDRAVDDLVGDPVADLVRMSFGHRFAGEKIARTPHDGIPSGNGKAETAQVAAGLKPCSCRRLKERSSERVLYAERSASSWAASETHELDDAFADLGVLDAGEMPDELQAFRGRHHVGHIGGRVALPQSRVWTSVLVTPSKKK